MPRRMLAETKAACGWFPMKMFTQSERLTDAEFDRLGDFLKSCKGGRAMNVETLDGFFAALIAGPETVMPSEYYPEVFGGEMSDTCEFGSLDEANEILGLMMRHWNDIAGTLFKGEVYVPLLLEDEGGVAHGNDWARGFMRSVLWSKSTPLVRSHRRYWCRLICTGVDLAIRLWETVGMAKNRTKSTTK